MPVSAWPASSAVTLPAVVLVTNWTWLGSTFAFWSTNRLRASVMLPADSMFTRLPFRSEGVRMPGPTTRAKSLGTW